MRKSKTFLAMALAGVLVSGCAANGYGQKQTGGALLGGALGGLLGSQIGGESGKLAATAGLAVLGLIIGNEAGRSLDKADQLYAAETTQRALEISPVNEPMVWQNPTGQVYGTVTPVRTYQTDNGRYCREFQQDITIGGETKRGIGKACRNPDGTWEMVSRSNSTVVVQQPAPVIVQQPVYRERVIIHRGRSCRWVYHRGRSYCGRWR